MHAVLAARAMHRAMKALKKGYRTSLLQQSALDKTSPMGRLLARMITPRPATRPAAAATVTDTPEETTRPNDEACPHSWADAETDSSSSDDEEASPVASPPPSPLPSDSSRAAQEEADYQTLSQPRITFPGHGLQAMVPAGEEDAYDERSRLLEEEDEPAAPPRPYSPQGSK